MFCKLQVVQSKMLVSKMPCKCLGVSATCTVLSCPQQKLSEFSVLANEILRIYLTYTCRHTSADGSSTHNGGSNETIGDADKVPAEITVRVPLQSSCSPPPGEKHFLFLDESPNYCVRDPAVGSLGTSGRECDPHSTGPNSCENLCTQCGRGHANVTVTVEETCYCSFSYCCEIQCHKCLRTQFISVCA